MLIMSVDTGNKMIKTENLEFHSGLEILDQMPGEKEEVIRYEDKYYLVSNKRIAYMENKTEDDRYFILTLIAIAKELEQLKQQETEPLIPNGLIEIELLVGLPPVHYGKLRDAFRKYFYRDGQIIDFFYMGIPYKIAFSDVKVYIQAYAAYVLIAGKQKLSTYQKVLLIDIGGFTVDYMVLRLGCIDWNLVDSLEEGVILFYRKVKAGIRKKYGILLEESDIDNILLKKETSYEEGLIERVNEIARQYVTELLGTFRELGIDFGTTLTVFVGGGSILQSEFIRETWKWNQVKYFIVNDSKANAKGYKLQYLAEKNLF